MKLLELRSESFRGLPDGTYSLTDNTSRQPLDVAVISGAPRSGKTALLEAVVAAKETIGPYGFSPPVEPLLRNGATNALLETTWLLSPREVSLAEIREPICRARTELVAGKQPHTIHDVQLDAVLRSYRRDSTTGKLEYFADDRALPSFDPDVPRLAESSEARLRLTRDPLKYQVALAALLDAANEAGRALTTRLAEQGVVLGADAPDPLASFRDALAALAPDLRFTRAASTDLLFQRSDGTALSLTQLSASERQAVLFAVTFWHTRLNHSIVLIDSPELHLHPSEHAPFLQRLCSLGQDNQLFIATNSDAIASAALPSQRIQLDA